MPPGVFYMATTTKKKTAAKNTKKKTNKVKIKEGSNLKVDLFEVRQLASLGLSQRQIAYKLGMSARTFYNYKNDCAEFAEAYRRGRSKGVADVANSLFQKCKEGDVHAMKFYLSVVGKWRESKAVEVTGADGGAIQTENKTRVTLTAKQAKILDKVLDERF